ncbi:PsiF family protein [Dyella lutea]|uniref:PsiF family protein n=1 Tax=Dyella lutea TaxID=2950441 RepID=A0ABT1F9V2_9GAMM|nr:PsiF family protein [Dyella lutea]MCP1374142.1 PsiF family protein [Dyella lutea]
MGKPFRILFAAALAVAGALVLSTPVVAAAKPMTTQQQRMADCNKQAAGKKGDERKAFMKSCLKGGAAAAPGKMTQQEKMKKCNADAKAKSLKGDARKSFMSTCLKG